MSTITLKDINRLALPAIFAGIADPLISLADTAIIGHLGTAELGGVGVATSFFSFLFWTVGQTRTALGSLVAQYYGRNQLEGVRSLVTQGVLFNIALGFLLIAITLPFSTEIFEIYKAEGAILSNANEYWSIRVLGFPLLLGAFGIFGVFRGLQNTVWAMHISLIGAGANIVLDLLLVYGIDGIVPSFGVKGAAIASVSAHGLMLILAIIYLIRKYPEAYELTFKLNPEFKRMLGMAGNLFIRTAALSAAFFFATRFATSYGDEQIAAHTMALNIWLFSAFFIDGYAQAGNALGGKLVGSSDYSNLYKMGKSITRISLLIATALAAVYGIGYTFTADFFTDSPQVASAFESIYWLVILMQPINGIAFALDGIFKGMGKTALLRNVLLAATFLGFIPAIYCFDWLGLGLHSVWMAFFVWMIVRAGSLAVVFYNRYRSV